MMDAPTLLKEIERGILLGAIDEVPKLCKQAIEINIPAKNVLEAMEQGIRQVGEEYEKGEYFLPELIMAGKAMKDGFEILEPLIKVEKVAFTGTIVMGSVLGDVHDIGKNIVVSMLRSAGFNVVDLGINVPSETFVQKAKELGTDIIAASAYTSSTMWELRTVVEMVEDAGLRDRVMVIVGGASTNQAFATSIGADGWAVNAASAVGLVKHLLAERKGEGR